VFGCVVCYLAGRRLDSSDSWVWNMRGAEGKKSIAQSVVVLHLLQHARLQSARNRWGGLFGHTVVYDAGLCMVFLASEDPDFDLRFPNAIFGCATHSTDRIRCYFLRLQH
jgi:hypothetical protein